MPSIDLVDKLVLAETTGLILERLRRDTAEKVRENLVVAPTRGKADAAKQAGRATH